MFKKIQKYVVNDWIASIYLILSGTKTLDISSKEIIVYYYNKYIQKEVNNYYCNNKLEYNIIDTLAKHMNQINITLPKYPIIENTKDDSINQYLPKSCQQYYFQNNLYYYEHINSPQKEYFKKVLKEKFDY